MIGHLQAATVITMKKGYLRATSSNPPEIRFFVVVALVISLSSSTLCY